MKRTAKRISLPPSSLERSICNAPIDIEEEKNRGISRFGTNFQQGDYIAIFAIQDITIQLQGSLLKKLHDATLRPEVADFRGLSEAADIGRDGTIAALVTLQQRLMQATPITELPMLTPKYDNALSQVEPSDMRMSQVFTVAPAPASYDRTHGQTTTWRKGQQANNTPSGRRGKRSSLLPGFRRHTQPRSDSHDHSPVPDIDQFRRVMTLPSGPDDNSSTAMPRDSVQTQSSSWTYQPWEDNPAEIWGSRSTRSSSGVPPQVRTPSRRLSMGSSLTSVPHPTSENGYLGYCKGAWKVQNGDRGALTKATDWSSRSAKSGVHYLSCYKCRFEGHFNPKTIWNKLWTDEAKGIKVRWSFLAQSHIPQKNYVDRRNADECMFSYKCLFCVYLGYEAPVLHGKDLYLHHIDQTHRGAELNEIVRYRTGCINNRVCADSEEFDINLFPVTDCDIVELG